MQANDAAGDIALIEYAVREAGKIARSYYGGDYRRWSKSRGEPVTEADLAIDRYLRSVLEPARPHYGWLSEETGRNAARADAKRVFVVDPIDGTTAFLKQRPHFAISVGIVENDRAIAGVVYNPVTEEFFCAARNGGARLNGAPIRASGCACIEGCRMLCQKTLLDRDSWPAMQVDHRSSIAYRMALVAAGIFDAAIVLSPKHDWDMAAGAAIVHEAGGFATSRNGDPLQFNGPSTIQRSLVCAGPRLHELLVERLR